MENYGTNLILLIRSIVFQPNGINIYTFLCTVNGIAAMLLRAGTAWPPYYFCNNFLDLSDEEAGMCENPGRHTLHMDRY